MSVTGSSAFVFPDVRNSCWRECLSRVNSVSQTILQRSGGATIFSRVLECFYQAFRVLRIEFAGSVDLVCRVILWVAINPKPCNHRVIYKLTEIRGQGPRPNFGPCPRIFGPSEAIRGEGTHIRGHDPKNRGQGPRNSRTMPNTS